MDSGFLSAYNAELRYIREMAGEFARAYPKVAGRLALDPDGQDVSADPFIERLLEGFAFLTARIQRKYDAEFPRFTQDLMETLYPQYLSPAPSMAVVRYTPQEDFDALKSGYIVPRQSEIRGVRANARQTPCIFRTGYEIKIWPFALNGVRYYERDLDLLSLPAGMNAGVESAIVLTLNLQPGATLEDLDELDQLDIHLRGADDVPVRIYEHLVANCSGIVLKTGKGRDVCGGMLPASHMRPLGFARDESLFPPDPRTFDGYRILREYFAFPQRFHFLRLEKLDPALRQCEQTDNTFDLVFLFNRSQPYLEKALVPENFDIHCVPAINLFKKKLDRVNLQQTRLNSRVDYDASGGRKTLHEGMHTFLDVEYPVIADKNRRLDFEIFSVDSVLGIARRAVDHREFRNFFQQHSVDRSGKAYYSLHRMPRELTLNEQAEGPRSSYLGSEVFISLVDDEQYVARGIIRQLEITATCTNRHRPLGMSIGGGSTDFAVESGPIESIRFVGSPTPPRDAVLFGETLWRLVGHLKVNYLSFRDQREQPEHAAGKSASGSLKELLALYVDLGNHDLRKQVEGITDVRGYPLVKRVRAEGPSAFARGVHLDITVDELVFGDSGVFLMGSAITQFYAKYVSVNSFVEVALHSVQRGHLHTWPPLLGYNDIL